LTGRGMEFVVEDELTTGEKKEFEKFLKKERDVAKIIFGKAYTYLDLIYS